MEKCKVVVEKVEVKLSLRGNDLEPVNKTEMTKEEISVVRKMLNCLFK